MTTFRQAPALFTLIGINVFIFLAQNLGWDLRQQGALWLPESQYYQSHQWLTHLFLHDNLLHLLFNMYALGVLGRPLNTLLGNLKFLLLYLLSGLFAALFYLAYPLYLITFVSADLLNETQTQLLIKLLFHSSMLGASGAVCGVAAAFAVCLPQARLGIIFLPFSLPARHFVLLFTAYELFAQFSGFSIFGNNIAHLAHVGGVIAGTIIALFFQWHLRKKLLNHRSSV